MAKIRDEREREYTCLDCWNKISKKEWLDNDGYCNDCFEEDD